jgi:hypothetical protein
LLSDDWSIWRKRWRNLSPKSLFSIRKKVLGDFFPFKLKYVNMFICIYGHLVISFTDFKIEEMQKQVKSLNVDYKKNVMKDLRVEAKKLTENGLRAVNEMDKVRVVFQTG